MAIFDGIWQFFSSGGAVGAIMIAVCTVSYIFFVTFFVGLFVLDIAAAGKGCFVWFGDFGVVAVFSFTVLDVFSAGRLGLFYCALAVLGSTILFYIEYGLLLLQRNVARGIIRKNREKLKEKEQGDKNRVIEQANDKSHVFRTKTGGITEVALRRCERLPMEKAPSAGLATSYACDCIKRLKGKRLTPEELDLLKRVETSLTPPLSTETAEGRRDINDSCCKLITLMAKYFGNASASI